ncbi:Phosphoglycolate phosphatase [Paenibacillus auburnensis]|uniref:Phosphoglycolate phosphatase n=1 Tax=Paenibacillus auburnensis TaxID=2905649 RepID=A0ABM9CFB0_9BACL|nr:HAD-IA family hydrolase [Paenibacillus auburnensis]CAH1211265.1 Phosphoglycolate phosphatase [Paenibacillus auburnensis]
MHNIKAIIFDLDDTLYQEEDYVKSGFKYVSNLIELKTALGADYVYDQLLLLFENDKSRVFNRFLELQEITDAELESLIIQEYRHHKPSISLLPENIEILQWLKNQGFMIGIITDGRPEGQKNKIEALGLYDYCNHVIVTDELGGIEFRKPNKIGFINMLTHFKIKPDEAIYLGDNPTKDFVACNNLGMKTIMLVNGKGLYSQEVEDPDYFANISIQSLEELKTILESWES